jgi:hypothetical protein
MVNNGYMSKALVTLSKGFITWFKIIEPHLKSKGVSRTNTLEQDTSGNKIRSNSASAARCYRKLLALERDLSYHRKIWNKMAGKHRLFLLLTPDGVEFGTGSLATQLGDRVCLISGLPIPMLLRETATPRRYTRQGQEGQAKVFSVV